MHSFSWEACAEEQEGPFKLNSLYIVHLTDFDLIDWLD